MIAEGFIGDQTPISVENENPERHMTNNMNSGKGDKHHVALENVLEEVGVPGRYQVVHVVLTSLCVAPFICIIFNYTFLAYEPDHSCSHVNETELLSKFHLQDDSTAMVFYDSCAIRVTSNKTGHVEDVASTECYNGYKYEEIKEISMVTEWDMVCDRQGIVELVQLMLTIGCAIGSVLFSQICDRYGRRNVFLANSALVTASEIGLSFAPNIYTAIVLRFFSGLFAGGFYISHYVMCTELVISKHRRAFGVLHATWWSTSLVILSGMAFAFGDDWRHFQFVVGLLCSPMVIIALSLNETPAFYFAKAKHDNALQILQKASKVNGRNFRKVEELYKLLSSQIFEGSKEESVANYFFIDILCTWQLLIMVLISSLVWFTVSLSYYGLYLTSVTLNSNRYLNFFLMAVVEIPGCLLMIPLLSFFGRRTVVCISLTITGLSLSASAAVSAVGESNLTDYISIASYLLGSFFLSSSFGVLWAYTPEMYPTTIRSIATGISASASRLAGAVAPYFLPLHNVVPWAPGLILFSLCIVSGILILKLPETKGRQLPTTIEEVMAWKKEARNNENSLLLPMRK